MPLPTATAAPTATSPGTQSGAEMADSAAVAPAPTTVAADGLSRDFVVTKIGTHPMRTRLRLFLEWGITFGKPYQVPERAARKVAYAGKRQLTQAIIRKKRGTTPPADQGRGQINYNTVQRR